MKAVRIVLVILGIYALLHVTAQSFRHAYILNVEARTSALAEFEPVKEQLAEAKDLDELVAFARASHAKLKEWEAGKSSEELRQADHSEEPYHSFALARDAIETWEDHLNQLRELHFFWWCGAVCLLAGLVVWQRSKSWLAIAFFTIAIGEMIYWTSPAIRIWDYGEEFNRLIFWKLIYSAATLTILLAMWIKLGADLQKKFVQD